MYSWHLSTLSPQMICRVTLDISGTIDFPWNPKNASSAPITVVFLNDNYCTLVFPKTKTVFVYNDDPIRSQINHGNLSWFLQSPSTTARQKFYRFFAKLQHVTGFNERDFKIRNANLVFVRVRYYDRRKLQQQYSLLPVNILVNIEILMQIPATMFNSVHKIKLTLLWIYVSMDRLSISVKMCFLNYHDSDVI